MIMTQREGIFVALLMKEFRHSVEYKDLDDGDLQYACVDYVQSDYQGSFRDFMKENNWSDA